MAIQRVITHGGLTIDLEDVKGFRVNSQLAGGGRNTRILIVEFKSTKIEYVFNPDTDEHELQTFNDKIEVEFMSFEAAEHHMIEWAGIWEHYLNQRDE